jgi:kynureninase
LPVDLTSAKADFAVGCTYKYLNGGPGAPAFTYVSPTLANVARQPLTGWMGHLRPFDFASDYQPAPGARRFVCGTPQILSLAALSESLKVWENVDLLQVRSKSLALTDVFMRLIDQECAGLGLQIVTPRHANRGSHVSVAYEHGYPVMRALAQRKIIGDFRAPNLMRFGFTPLYCSFADVAAAVSALKSVLVTEQWRDERYSLVGDVT